MPNWKKVIVSGSDAALNSLNVTNGLTVTGSLNVTGSTTQIGNNTLLGNTTLSGSIIISGSTTTPTVQVYGNVTHDGYIRFNPVSTNLDPSISASYIYVSGSTNDLYFSQNGSGYANTTRLRWLEGNLYTGLLHGGLITTASSTTFNISSGSGVIVSLNASLADDPYPTVQYVNWGNLTNQPLTYLTSSIQTFVGINSAGTIIQQTDPWIDGQYNTSISIGTILHQNTASINGTISYPNVAYGWKQRSYDFVKAFGPLKLSGYIIYPSSSLGLTVGSGTAWADGRNYQTDPNNPSYITDPGTNVSKIFRYYVSGSTYNQDTNGGLGYTTIDPTLYNNNGVLTSVPSNKPWSNQRVFYYPNSVTKGIVVYYGSAIYASQTEAVANLQYENFQETPNTQQNAIYLGTITIKYNGNFTNTNDYIILPAGIFRNVGGSGGGGAVTSTLAGLSDVSITGPTNGQPLVYNSSSLKWENQSTLTANLVGNASTATTASYALTASYTPSIAGTDNYIPKFNGSSALENSVMYDDGTNIGVGTTTPGYKLDVTGLINATTTPGSYGTIIRVRDTVTSGVDSFGGVHFTSSPGTDYTIGKWTTAAGAGLLQVRDQSGNQFMTINSAGNVGIGTTSPANKLSVSLGAFSNGSTVASILNTNSTQKAHVVYDTLLIQQDDAPTLRLYETDENLSTTISSDGGLTSFATTGEMGLFVAGSSTSAGWTGLNGIQAIRIKSDGKVGIGTTTPGELLSLAGATSTTFGLSLTPNGWNGAKHRLTVPTSGDSSMWSFNWNGSSIDASYAPSAITLAQGLIQFYTTGSANVPTERMRIDSSGNVGVGTTSPSTKLHVGAASVNQSSISTSNSTNLGLFVQAVGNDNVTGNLQSGITFGEGNSGLYSYDAGGSGAQGLSIFTGNFSSLSEKMRITNAGDVGIGTSSPSALLDINSSTTNDRLALSYGGSTKSIFGVTTGGDFYIYNNASVTFPLWVNNVGNVGIGTATPSYKLDVSGDIHVQTSSTVGTVYFGNSAQNYLSYSNSDSYYRANGAHYFEGSGFYKGIWNADGNLGVGTTSVAGNSTNRVVSIVGADSANLVLTETGGASAAFTSFGNEVYIGTSTNHPFYMYTSGSERMRIGTNGAIKFNAYGSGTFTGTATQKLAVDSSGNVIEIPIGAGPVDGSGTANYITRWVDTDTITTSSIYETGGNIGIGTTSPNTALEVNRNVSFSSIDTYAQLVVKTTSGANGKLLNIGVDESNSISFIQSLNRGTDSMPLILQRYSGNVGIGTTTPGSKLEVAGGIASTFGSTNGYVALQAGGATVQGYIEWFKPGPTRVGYMGYNDGSTANNLAIQLENSANFLVNGGNVGINTLTPAYRLSVVGKMALNDGGNSVFIGDNAGLSDDATANVNVGIGTNALQTNISGSGNVAVGSNALQFSTAPNNTAVGNNASRFTTTGFSNTSLGSFALWQNLDGIENTGLGTTALLSNTSGSGNTGVGTNALRANTSGSNNTGVGVSALSANILGNDNVAIGRSAGRFFGTGTSNNTSASGSIFIGLTSRANASGEENQIVIGMNALGLGSNTVVLGNDNIVTTALKGSVGIGTNVPMGPLEIYRANPAGLGGHLILNNSGTNVGNETAILFNDSGGGSVSSIRAAISSTTEGSPYNGDIKFKTGNTTYGSLSTRMIITGAGNVGIGTTSPGVKLEVYDSANANAVTITSDGANQQLVIRRYSNTDEQLIFGVHSSDYSYIQAVEQNVSYRALSLNPNGGNVGIGTTNPSYLLDVNGTARVTTLIETSAAKYKTNIQPLEPQLSKVTQLEPVTFDWLDKPQTKTNIGLIADEVEKIYPEFVSKTEDGEIEGIEYSKLTTVLIQSIKELKEIVDQQQAQINKLLNK